MQASSFKNRVCRAMMTTLAAGHVRMMTEIHTRPPKWGSPYSLLGLISSRTVIAESCPTKAQVHVVVIVRQQVMVGYNGKETMMS